jgi:hypothetical protein
MRTVIVAFVVGLLASVGGAQAADRFVSTKGNDQGGTNTCLGAPACRTIANALVHATSGDIIKVAKGTYTGSAAITVSGSWTIRGGYKEDFSDATRDVVKNKTTVTGNKNNRFLLIHATAGDAIVIALDGLAVSNSESYYPISPGLFQGLGGGILAVSVGGSIELDLNQIKMTGNKSDFGGGGLTLSVESSGSIVSRITSSLFKANKDGISGGAILAQAFTASTLDLTIEDTRFESNKAFSGGAIGLFSAGTPGVTATIRRSVFLNNTGVRVSEGTIGRGGAIEVFTSDVLDGALASAALILENSVLQGNKAGTGGAIGVGANINGAPFPPSTTSVLLDLRNNTIVANKATFLYGGGLDIVASGYAGAPPGSSIVSGALLNNIIRGNTAASLPASGDILFLPGTAGGASTSFTLTTNNIGSLANFGTVSATPDPQLNVDPLLVKKQGIYRLKATSPMIGAGTCDGAPVDDFEGNARPTGTGLCGIDIGADEFVAVP